MAGHRINRRELARGGVRAGSDGSNYTDINTGGYQTMAGCARVWQEIPLPARVWYGAPTACTHALSGSLYITVGGAASGGIFHVPTWSPSSATCDMLVDTAIFAPADIAATGGSMTLYLEHIVNTAMDSASVIGWRINWNYINGVGTSSVKSGSATYAASTLSASGQGTHFSATFGTKLPSFDQVGQLLLITARMLTSNVCSAGVSLDFAGARLRYLADRIGASGT